MFRALALVAALAFAVAPAYAADAGPYKLDAKGNCHAASGKFAKKEMCAATPVAAYTLDAKGKCHDPKGKFAKADKCKPH